MAILYLYIVHLITEKKKHNYFRGKDCKKILFKRFKNHAIKIINYEKKEMKTLTNKDIQLYHKQNTCHKCKN